MNYLTLDSTQIHRAWREIDCDIEPGKTEKIDVKSWDTQKSFYYYLSDAPKYRRATPYTVIFDPVTIYLRRK